MSSNNKKAGTNLLFNPFTDGDNNNDDNKVMAKDKYGMLPKSIWSLRKDSLLVKNVADMISKGSYSDGKKKKGQKDLSLLNPTVVYHLLKYFTEEGDIVLAPYSSRGVVGLTAHLMGRNSFNTEIVPTYHNDMVRRAKEAYKKDSGLALEFYLDDARYLKTIPSNFADFTYFNPPYWNVEKYESTDGQMSDCETYDEFLEFYSDAIKAKYRVTKPGGWCVANLNDFRKDGELIDFHGDTIRLMKEAGFKYHDIIINEIFSRSITSIGQVEQKGTKIMAKCLAPWTLIYTIDGVKQIKDINIGDLVLSHSGEYNKVLNTFNREYDGDVYVVKTKYNNDEMIITDGHPIYIYRNGNVEWVKPEDISVGNDYIIYPVLKETNDIKVFDISNYIKLKDMYSVKQNSIVCYESNQYGISETVKASYPRFINMDNEFAKICGLFIGDGNCGDNSIVFTYGIKKQEAIKFTYDYFVKAHYDVCIDTIEETNAVRVIVRGRPLSMFMKQFFYNDDSEKVIPRCFMILPIEKQHSFIDGYIMADGFKIYNGKSNGFTTTSESLAEQLFQICIRLKIVCSKQYIECGADSFAKTRKDQIKGIFMTGYKPQYIWLDNGDLAIKIVSSEKHSYDEYYNDGYVYNFEVEKDNSYVTNFGCVHNCHEYILVFKKPFEDGTVWKSYHEYRASQRKNIDCKKIKGYHTKKGIKIDHGYSWEWGEE